METALWAMWDDSQNIHTEKKHRQTKSKIAAHHHADENAGQSLTLGVEIVSATRFSESDFWSKSALGLSLKRHLKQDARLSASIAFENSRGLSEVFNDCIEQADDNAILVFIHDDVWIDEAGFADTVIEGLKHYDVIGVAGNRRRLPNQPAWAFIDHQLTWDDQSNLSGRIAHGKSAFGEVEDFGAVPAECELLDGVFLASKKSSLKQHEVRFDTQFDFHFYDLDFCRSARKSGLRLGTWLISLTHQSLGDFGGQHWGEKYQCYLKKWEVPLANNMMVYSQDKANQTERDLQQAVNEVLQMALEHQNAGRIAQAEHLYLEILNIQPKHAEANHNLGIIEAHMKGAATALPRLEVAVQTKPEIEQFWVSYIDALMQSGATDSAIDALELGKKYGLKSETAQRLAAEFVIELESMMATHQDLGHASPFGVHIHQIYYSEQTQRDNDSGFIGLNNLANARPDWREYWPIRNYLLTNSLNEDDYYGFFSPKFKAKTNLDAAAVHEFIRASAGAADVFLFSPFFDQGAFHFNIFEQAVIQHQDIMAAFKGSIALIAPTVDLATLVMDSRNTVFCNYIVAKPAFWKVWLENCELIFAEAERNKTALAASLNSYSNHDGGVAPNKVFVIERIASLLLSTQQEWKVKAYNPTLLPYSNAPIAKYPFELLTLDALKIASESQAYPQYLTMFKQMRQSILGRSRMRTEADVISEREQEMQQAVNDVLQMALEHQNAGRIAQAEHLYLEILNIQPKHAEANHNLGVMEAHMKGAVAALPRLEIAVQAKPETEQFWVSYIDALMQSGATDTAVDALELGKKYGLRSETAQMLAAEFVVALEAMVVPPQHVVHGRESKSICPVCDKTNAGFSALPSSHRDSALKHGYAYFGQCEMTALDTYSCLSCGASDRERLYAYWIDLQLSIKMLTDKSRVIHFAPERTLSNKLRTLGFNSYHTADLMMVGCDYQVDMMRMPFTDESYDFFICSHVLEHVESDDKAIAELFRIMKKGGYGILMAPIVMGLEKTQEDASVKDEAGRWKFYGQNDHVRLYAHDDYVKKIQSHGFHVEQFGEESFGEAVFHSLGLKQSSILYVVTK